MDNRKSKIFICSLTLALSGCAQYGGALYADVRHVGETLERTYLIPKNDWLRTAQSEVQEGGSTLSVGDEITFESGQVRTTPGSKVLAWRCRGEWKYREYILDLERRVVLETICP